MKKLLFCQAKLLSVLFVAVLMSACGNAPKYNKSIPAGFDALCQRAIDEWKVPGMGKQLDGIRWRRQFGVGPYILDFYCPQLRLCIELDGAPHDTLHGSQYDCRREEWLQHTHGIRTLRFENKDVFVHQDAVIERIREVMKEILG